MNRAGTGSLPSLTGMRMVAAGVVLFSHVGWLLPRSHAPWLDSVMDRATLGVNFFFVLSGFVLAWSWREGTGAATFYGRRFARIWPSHAVMWAVVMLVSIGAVTMRTPWGSAMSNLVLLQSWRESSALSVNSVAWTLSCEMFFYATFPIVWPLFRRLGRTQLIVLTVALVAVPFAIGVVGAPTYWLLHFPPSRIWEFLVGMALGRMVQTGALRWAPPVPVGVLALLAVVAVATRIESDVSAVALPLLPIGAIVVRGALNDLAGRRGVLHSRVAQIGGAWSFAFYLVHAVPFRVVEAIFVTHHLGWLALAPFVGLVALGVAGAGALHTWVEVPTERYLRRRLDLAVPAPAA